MARPLPQFDTLDDQPGLSPSLLRELDIKGSEQFIAAHPEFYGSDYNSDLLNGFLESRGVPYTLRNLEIAYYSLLEDGAFEERPPEPVEVPADNFVQRLTHIWQKDSRPKSATSLVLDPKTAEAKAAVDGERAARVVERQSQPIPGVSVDERGITRVAQSSRPAFGEPTAEVKEAFADKPFESDIARKKRDANLKAAATAQRVAIAKSKGNYNRG